MKNFSGKTCGRLLLMAGGEHGRRGSDDALSSFVESVGVKAPRVAYLGAASDDDSYYYSITKGVLQASGAGEVWLERFGKGFAERLAAADLVFVSGGDVELGIENLKKRKALQLLDELFRGGKPFAGVSAGSIMLGESWVRWSDPDDDSTASLFPCLGFAKLICDTHDESDGWSELKAAVKLAPDGAFGVGIPAGGALLAEPDGSLLAKSRSVVRFRSAAGACEPLGSLCR